MIKEIKTYQTDDGCIFSTLVEAEKYDVLLQTCNEIEAKLMTTPEDDMDFANGTGWIQHPKGSKITLGMNLLNLTNKHFNTSYINLDGMAKKIIHSSRVSCLNHLFNRYTCISNDDREFGQIFFAEHPNKAKGGQINGST